MGQAAVSPGCWVPCICGEYWCLVHQEHACDCPCPPVEEWGDVNPYSADGSITFCGDPDPAASAAAVQQVLDETTIADDKARR